MTELLLHGGEQFFADERRDRDAQPLLGRHMVHGDRSPWHFGMAALGAHAGAQGTNRGLAEGRRAAIRRVLAQAVHPAAVPGSVLVRRGTPAAVSRRPTSPMLRCSCPTQVKIWRTTRASSRPR